MMGKSMLCLSLKNHISEPKKEPRCEGKGKGESVRLKGKTNFT